MSATPPIDPFGELDAARSGLAPGDPVPLTGAPGGEQPSRRTAQGPSASLIFERDLLSAADFSENTAEPDTPGADTPETPFLIDTTAPEEPPRRGRVKGSPKVPGSGRTSAHVGPVTAAAIRESILKSGLVSRMIAAASGHPIVIGYEVKLDTTGRPKSVPIHATLPAREQMRIAEALLAKGVSDLKSSVTTPQRVEDKVPKFEETARFPNRFPIPDKRRNERGEVLHETLSPPVATPPETKTTFPLPPPGRVAEVFGPRVVMTEGEDGLFRILGLQTITPGPPPIFRWKTLSSGPIVMLEHLKIRGREEAFRGEFAT